MNKTAHMARIVYRWLRGLELVYRCHSTRPATEEWGSWVASRIKELGTLLVSRSAGQWKESG